MPRFPSQLNTFSSSTVEKMIVYIDNESLICDSRSRMSPAEAVERKLRDVLRQKELQTEMSRRNELTCDL